MEAKQTRSLIAVLGAMGWVFMVGCAGPPRMAREASTRAGPAAGDELQAMRLAVQRTGRFKDEFERKRAEMEVSLAEPIEVPIPRDAGGGYTHERHKENYRVMYDAGTLYQLTTDERYARYVRDMLLQYAQLYPTLPIHPETRSANAGKIFWQGLNEAVWLVHTIQAYEAVLPALSEGERSRIEAGVLRPVALFLSEESPHIFNKVHNHGTWSTAAVGMTGYVLGELGWVERALRGLDESGQGGFLRQLDDLFSPDGYYTEGPYYQRYALMPFVTFARAIQRNQPERKIFEYRDGIVLKAVHTTIQLSYAGLFFPLNDAIKSKGIETIELVHGVALAYGLTGERGLLDIASQQGVTLLTRDGLKVARDLERGLQRPYPFASRVFGDGARGKDGALVVMRRPSAGKPTVVFKATSQGMGHGHFDKLTWQFYESDREIVSDYGAARFLNVEAKYGGRYLPENASYARQTVAHNTLVVDERSHFDGDSATANRRHPELLFAEESGDVFLASARMSGAYADTRFTRTMALMEVEAGQQPLVIDLLRVESSSEHQYDLPVHYQGQLIDASFDLGARTSTLVPLGKDNGYEHLWLRARAAPGPGLARISWLNDNGRFYSYSTLATADLRVLMTQLGANDPNFNLRSESAFILRAPVARDYDFVGMLEPHGEYNPSAEYTRDSNARVSQLLHQRRGDVEAVSFTLSGGQSYVLAFNTSPGLTARTESAVEVAGKPYGFTGRFKLFPSSAGR